MFDNKTKNGIEYKIEGNIFPVLTVALNTNQKIYSESGAMSFMTSNTNISCNTKGFFKIFSRYLTRENLFVTEFTSINDVPAQVSFSAALPGKIVPIMLEEGESVYCQKDSFLCAESTVDLKAVFTKHIMAGLLGGEGIIIQKITGPGTCFIEVDGELETRALSKDETLNIDEGHLACWESTVDYNTKVIGGGPLNWILGGEGVFISTAKGPGMVMLQTLPAKKLANKLFRIAFPPKKGRSHNNNQY